MSNPQQPDVNGIWALRPQAISCGNDSVADCPAAAVDVDGDDLSVVVGFDLAADVMLVDLIAEASDFLGGPASICHGLPRWYVTSKR